MSPTQPEPPSDAGPDRSDGPQHVLAVIVIGIASAFVAMLVSPADPISWILATASIVILALSAYAYGFRKGGRAIR